VVASHQDGRRGFWALAVAGGPARLVVSFDDPTLEVSMAPVVAVSRDHLFFAVQEYESDIWLAKLRW